VDAIVAPCNWARDLLVSNGVPSDKITQSRQGVAKAPSKEVARRPGQAARDLRVVYLGRSDPTKGPDTLIRAIRQLPGRALEADFYGIGKSNGEDPYTAQLRRLAGGDHRIRLMPPLPHEEMLQRLPSYHIVAVPSRWLETGPLVVLEAFAAGVPVLGSKLGGIAELVRDGVDGLLLEGDSVGVWASAIRRLDEDRGALERLRQGVRAPRTMDDVAEDMTLLYRRLCTHQRPVVDIALVR